MLAAAVMMPTTTDARGGGGGSFGGHGGAHFGLPGTVRTTGPSIACPATVRRSFGSSSRHVASSNNSFSHRNGSFNRSRRIESHFVTLGADGIWANNFVYTPTMLVMQPSPIMPRQTLRRHASVIRTPGPAHAGILVVRGDSKSYVTSLLPSAVERTQAGGTFRQPFPFFR
jgi:hypothetical protein